MEDRVNRLLGYGVVPEPNWDRIASLREFLRDDEPRDAAWARPLDVEALAKVLIESDLISGGIGVPDTWADLADRLVQMPHLIDNADLHTLSRLLSVGIKFGPGNSNLILLRDRGILTRVLRRIDRLYDQRLFMATLGPMACPACGRRLRREETCPETKRTSCRTCGSVSSTDDALRTAVTGLKPSPNLFSPFYNQANPDAYRTYQYDVFVSYRHIVEDGEIADTVANALESRKRRVFHAPKTLSLENLYTDQLPTRWIAELKYALLRSAHFFVVLSPSFLASSYCELELRAAFEICSRNARRGLWLALLDLRCNELPVELQPFASEQPVAELAERVAIEVRRSGIVLGSDLVTPTACFDSLPLETAAWGEGRPFDPDPPRAEFENVVREMMVLSLRGLDLDKAGLNFSMTWQAHHVSAAKQEARSLLARGVPPFPLLPHERAREPSAFRTLASRAKPDSQSWKPQRVPLTAARFIARAEGWFDLEDFGGRGYPADIDWVCKKCGARKGGGNPDLAPAACPACGFEGPELSAKAR